MCQESQIKRLFAENGELKKRVENLELFISCKSRPSENANTTGKGSMWSQFEYEMALEKVNMLINNISLTTGRRNDLVRRFIIGILNSI